MFIAIIHKPEICHHNLCKSYYVPFKDVLYLGDTGKYSTQLEPVASDM